MDKQQMDKIIENFERTKKERELKVKDIAELLEVDKQTVRNWVKNDKLFMYKGDNGQYRTGRAAVVKFAGTNDKYLNILKRKKFGLNFFESTELQFLIAFDKYDFKTRLKKIKEKVDNELEESKINEQKVESEEENS